MISTKKRTPLQEANAVARACREINSIIDASVWMKDFPFFDFEYFDKEGRSKMITVICERCEVGEEYIRKITEIDY